MTPFLQAAIAEMLPGAGPGDACSECSFAWSTDGDTALDHLRGAADRYAVVLRGRDATRKPAPQVWSPSGYVWHVGDVVRAWAERLHDLSTASEASWAAFDPDELARARGYDELPPSTGPWALARSTDALMQSLGSLDLPTAFRHPQWGAGTVADALRWLAHEAAHHELDIRRGLEPA